MNINDNEFVRNKMDELHSKFIFYSENLLMAYDTSKSKVTSWEYSLGASKDVIPFERLVPSVRLGRNKVIKKLTKTNSESKNLVTYGIDCFNNTIISIKRFDKNIEKHGEEVRIVDGDIILSSYIYNTSPEKNRLTSVCCSCKK